jgi:hypothetical protein
MPLKRTAIAITLVGLVGCAHRTGIQDYVRGSDYRLTYDQRLRFEICAPIIVLGQVLGARDIGRAAPSKGDPRVIVQLTRIRIDVEQVVKGVVGASPLEFSYFTFSARNRNSLGVPYYLPSIGQHRIFFLEPSEHTYRSVGDLTDYTLRVMTGSHPKEFCKGKPPGCCIAEILLVPGEGLNRRFFPAYLNEAHYAAGVLCSQAVARSLMGRLEQDPDELIAESARQVLWADDHPVPPRSSP